MSKKQLLIEELKRNAVQLSVRALLSALPLCSWAFLGSLESPAPPPSSWSHLDGKGLSNSLQESSSTSFLLISPGRQRTVQLSTRVQLHLLPLDLTWTAKDCPTLYKSPAPPPSSWSHLDGKGLSNSLQESSSTSFLLISPGRQRTVQLSTRVQLHLLPLDLTWTAKDCPTLYKSPAPPPSSWSHLDGKGLSNSLQESSSTSFLLISPGRQRTVQLSTRVQLHLLPLDLTWTAKDCPTLYKSPAPPPSSWSHLDGKGLSNSLQESSSTSFLLISPGRQRTVQLSTRVQLHLLPLDLTWTAKDCPTLYKSPAPPPSSWSHLDGKGLSNSLQESSSTSFLLISPGRQRTVQLSTRVQLHLLPLDLTWTAKDCPTLYKSPAPPPPSWSHLDGKGLSNSLQESSSTSFLLISPGRQRTVQLSTRVQLHLLPLDLTWTAKDCPTLYKSPALPPCSGSRLDDFEDCERVSVAFYTVFWFYTKVVYVLYYAAWLLLPRLVPCETACCHLSARSVYTTQPCTSLQSLHSKPHM